VIGNEDPSDRREEGEPTGLADTASTCTRRSRRRGCGVEREESAARLCKVSTRPDLLQTSAVETREPRFRSRRRASSRFKLAGPDHGMRKDHLPPVGNSADMIEVEMCQEDVIDLLGHNPIVSGGIAAMPVY
jgi:hypothetical protein